jgi:hypothetical protein
LREESIARLVERGCRERERNFVGREKGTRNQRRGRRPLELEREGKWQLEEEANLQRQGRVGIELHRARPGRDLVERSQGPRADLIHLEAA